MNVVEREIAYTIYKEGFEIYVVGGAVRDFMLGVVPKDYDFATNAKPKELMKLFKNSGKKIVTRGKSFKVVLVEGIEIATYRKDVQEPGKIGAKYCKPEYADSIEEDLKRRDLTFNAMAYKCFDGLPDEKVIIDLHAGYSDLKQGIIRMVGNPYERINQDPCRILRAARFFAAKGKRFDTETLLAMQDCAHYVKKYVEPDRIRIEILKAMELETPSLFFSALHLIGCLKDIFPEMDKCFNHDHGKYHIENIGEHCMHAGDVVSPRFPLLRLAAFLHDCGKPKAFKKQGDGSFVCHELYGGKCTEVNLKKLKFSKAETKQVAQLVFTHMYQCRGLTPKGIRKLHKRLADYSVDPRDFIRLKLADRSSNMCKGPNDWTPIKQLVINAGIRGYVEDIPFTTHDLDVSGGELITNLNLIPGPIVGKLQKHLLMFVIENGEEFNNKKLLLKEAIKYLKGKKC